jgi:hypothetical protein
MTTYSVTQVEQIAKTVFEYERKRPTYSSAEQHLAPVDTLTTGIPSRQLAWSKNIELGACPAELTADYHREHPLAFVTIFKDHLDLRDRFLARVRTDIENDVDDTGYVRWISLEADHIDGPPDPDMRFTKARPRIFHPYHAAWYTTEALLKLTNHEMTYSGSQTGHFLGTAAEALRRHKQDPSILRGVATKCVVRELDKRATASTSYTSLAEAIALADQDTVQYELLRRKDSVYQILCVTVPQAKHVTMVMGLKAVAWSKRLELLQLLGRAPTVEELLESNVKGATAVWRVIPWEVFGPLVEEHGNRLRAALFKRMGNEDLDGVLHDHEGRYKLKRSFTPWQEAAFGKETRSGRWLQFEQRAASYFPALRLREILRELYPEEVVRLIALRHLMDRQDLAQYLEPILTDAARHALASYALPKRS